MENAYFSGEWIFCPPIYLPGVDWLMTQSLGNESNDDRFLAGLHTTATDARLDKKRIEETKGGLVRNSYRWILDSSDFRRLRNDPNSRLLWIKGDPAKGKTMLLCGIIDELSHTTRLEDPTASTLLSFVLCEALDGRNNATAHTARPTLPPRRPRQVAPLARAEALRSCRKTALRTRQCLGGRVGDLHECCKGCEPTAHLPNYRRA